MKVLNGNSKFVQIFSEGGDSWELDGLILSSVEEFTSPLWFQSSSQKG